MRNFDYKVQGVNNPFAYVILTIENNVIIEEFRVFLDKLSIFDNYDLPFFLKSNQGVILDENFFIN